MALSTPRARAWTPGGIPSRILLLGLAAAVAVGSSYVVIAGTPFTRNQQVTTYQTAAVGQGTVQVTVAATGPITNPASVPLSFKSSGKLAEADVAIGQQVTAGQAQAALAQQQANLATVSAGATPEQAAVAQAQVDAAQTTLDNAQKSLLS